MIVDTHCHLIDEAFSTDVEEVILRAVESGVAKMVLACCDEGEMLPILDLAERHEGMLYATVGLHPENIKDEGLHEQLKAIRHFLDNTERGKIIAIGEIGLDLHWRKDNLKQQREALWEQMKWAIEFDLPVLLHIRDAMPQFMELLKEFTHYLNIKECPVEYRGKRLRGVMHCYASSAEEAKKAMLMADLMIGVGGTSTYKNSHVLKVVESVGLEHVVLETDAPYLAPVPKRGKRNEPSYTKYVAENIAAHLGIPVEEVERVTTENAKKLLITL